MDGIHDVGGRQGFGHVQELTAAGSFAEPWEGTAFVIGALAARISGGNPQHCYMVDFDSRELWARGAESFRLSIDLYEPYLEPVP